MACFNPSIINPAQLPEYFRIAFWEMYVLYVRFEKVSDILKRSLCRFSRLINRLPHGFILVRFLNTARLLPLWLPFWVTKVIVLC